MTLRLGLMLALVAFAVTLAYQFTARLSTEALNVAMGVLCGIAASIPVSFGLLIALTRERAPAHTPDVEDEPRAPATIAPSYTQPYAPPRTPQTPQIIVVAPPQGGYGNWQAPFQFPNYWMPSQPMEEVIAGRDWKIIGDDA